MSREAGIRSIPVRGMYLSIDETPNQICGDRFDQQVAKPGRVVGDGGDYSFYRCMGSRSDFRGFCRTGMESRCDFGEYLGSPKKTQHRGRSRQSAFAESSLWRTAGIGHKQTVINGCIRPNAAHKARLLSMIAKINLKTNPSSSKNLNHPYRKAPLILSLIVLEFFTPFASCGVGARVPV